MSLQSCPTLCNRIDSSPPGSPIPGILQARVLEWVAISFSNAWKWKVKVKPLSRVWLLATLWTAAYQAPPSMEFPRQEYWCGVLLPFPRSVTSNSKIHWSHKVVLNSKLHCRITRRCFLKSVPSVPTAKKTAKEETVGLNQGEVRAQKSGRRCCTHS